MITNHIQHSLGDFRERCPYCNMELVTKLTQWDGRSLGMPLIENCGIPFCNTCNKMILMIDMLEPLYVKE